ncbi:uncharacterized protein LOC131016514 [Salvia miltiorrhiza]|uniref:uncharacterized protein LOC131016514 n=1 Tax=Salvia miltiorrhiza TaxID=226208 RepID=UPI0025ACC8EC|nr:uncharacterized protein LOC131016514 [Salvia miltiorrhiza]
MACKIDIKKAFDTLRWDFLLKLHKYFECTRGIRQGDPLSPILFGITEDVLSALFKNCVASGHLDPMRMNRQTSFATHLLYADDILVFGRATEANARTILHILNFYGSLFGQICSMEKSHIFFGDKVQNSLRRSIKGILKFRRGTLPFVYLGVPIFAGAIKAIYLRAIHDRILLKFARWKGMHLSMAGRICLVKSVIQISITHSMMVYRWPKNLLKELDRKYRNFIWTGDVMKKPNCSVNWDRICAIKEEGGLGLRSFSLMNKCFLMNMAWKVICGQNFGHRIIKSRYLNVFCTANNVVASSIWSGLRPKIQGLVDDSYSYIGNGSSINFWRDDWLGYKLADRCRVPFYVLDYLSCSVADYFYDGIWHFTQDFINNYPEIVCDILFLPIGSDSDTRFWKPSVHGQGRGDCRSYLLAMQRFLVAAWNRDTSSQVRTFWKVGIITLIWAIWTLRNDCIFKDKVFYAKQLLQMVHVAFKEVDGSFIKIGHMSNTWSNYLILRAIDVTTRAAPPPIMINV